MGFQSFPTRFQVAPPPDAHVLAVSPPHPSRGDELAQLMVPLVNGWSCAFQYNVAVQLCDATRRDARTVTIRARFRSARTGGYLRARARNAHSAHACSVAVANGKRAIPECVSTCPARLSDSVSPSGTCILDPFAMSHAIVVWSSEIANVSFDTMSRCVQRDGDL